MNNSQGFLERSNSVAILLPSLWHDTYDRDPSGNRDTPHKWNKTNRLGTLHAGRSLDQGNGLGQRGSRGESGLSGHGSTGCSGSPREIRIPGNRTNLGYGWSPGGLRNRTVPPYLEPKTKKAQDNDLPRPLGR